MSFKYCMMGWLLVWPQLALAEDLVPFLELDLGYGYIHTDLLSSLDPEVAQTTAYSSNIGGATWLFRAGAMWYHDLLGVGAHVGGSFYQASVYQFDFAESINKQVTYHAHTWDLIALFEYQFLRPLSIFGELGGCYVLQVVQEKISPQPASTDVHHDYTTPTLGGGFVYKLGQWLSLTLDSRYTFANRVDPNKTPWNLHEAAALRSTNFGVRLTF